MAYPGNKGKRCQSWKRVPSVYGGRVERCASYGTDSRGYRRRAGGYGKGRVPFNKGKTCKSRKMVWSSFFKRNVERCASYKNGAAARTSSAPPSAQTRTLMVDPSVREYAQAAYRIREIPYLPGAPLPAYMQPRKPVYEARQIPLPGTIRRGPRGPQQAALPFQTGLSPELLSRPTTLPPPPPPRPRRPALTEHEKLMLAARKSPGRYLDGLW